MLCFLQMGRTYVYAVVMNIINFSLSLEMTISSIVKMVLEAIKISVRTKLLSIIQI